MHLGLVTIVVKDYDAAIGFFVSALGFELAEDSPASTNDGRPKRWVVVRPPGAATGLLPCLAAALSGQRRWLAGTAVNMLTVTEPVDGGPPALMPAAFIGHGNPMNALELNRYTRAWRAFGESVPRPRAILVISAHWYINATAVTAMRRPRTIHDFYGFPPELFQVGYPAPGLPELAAEVSDVAEPTWVGADLDSWGIDHGTWSVLVHAFPDASIPVVQLSINADKGIDYHLDLGKKLAPLRERGVLIIGSGNVVHNLRGMNWDLADGGFDWAQRFDQDARARMTENPADIVRLDAHRDFRHAVPTPDHFIPLLYLAGIADAAGHAADVMVDGYAYGSLSMTSYTLDHPGPPAGGQAGDGESAGESPPPAEAPPDESNI